MKKKSENLIRTHNCSVIKIKEIPIVDYETFFNLNCNLIQSPERHLSHYFAIEEGKALRIFSIISDDKSGEIFVLSTEIDKKKEIPSLTNKFPSFHPFERDIYERFNLRYSDHPWLKPLRYPFYSQEKSMDNYPFFSFDSEELHEVGVGPIHAGVIEPGHFRFICHGEKVLHLEIQLGYQHRGVEELFVKKEKLLERVILSESIAGDTTIGHSTAFANLYERLCGFNTTEDLHFSRALALELERIAIHTGDLSALSGDVAYQLGQAVFGRLRTPIINFTQSWGGNRLGRGLIRPGKINFPFTEELKQSLTDILIEYERDFVEMAETLFLRPSVQARFEKTGTITKDDVFKMGFVGMVAKSCGINRDVRFTHPHGLYKAIKLQPTILQSGDVHARAYLRYQEVLRSIEFIREILQNIPSKISKKDLSDAPLESQSLAISLTEGWRGEICHVALTDKNGKIAAYRIKDPSIHNWFALALAVRNNEISDFPLCNKSFNLSYCRHDL